MAQSKSKKNNRRGTTAGRTASGPASRNGQQGRQAAAPALPETPARPASAPQAQAGPGLVNGGAPAGLAPGRRAPGDRAPGDRAPGDRVPGPRVPPGLSGPRARPAAAKAAPAAVPAEAPDDLPAWAAKAAEKLLTVTCWLDPGEHGDPFTAAVYFSGRRAEVTGKPRPGDTFSQEETVAGIMPGSGPVAVTAEVRGVSPGEWTVTARPVARPGSSQVGPYPPPGANGAGALRVPWPRRVPIPPSPAATVRTAMLPLTKVPGVIRFAYATLVSLGVLFGLGLETLLLTAHHYSAVRPILLSAGAVAGGVVGAKLWYIGVHRGGKFDGWCIQGFVAGAAVVAGVAAYVGAGVPAGVFLSATAPALLLGIGIGRPGCFWAGCCTGRPTASRWGIWSSDRRVGCRREPAQLIEAVAALVIGLAVLAVVLSAGLQRSGPVAVAGLAAYTLSRQFALGLRSEPRRYTRGRQVVAAVAVIVLIASLALLARG
jgi:phosphatidylglycerol---prolipoprotein diacylglyceryl transferase